MEPLLLPRVVLLLLSEKPEFLSLPGPVDGGGGKIEPNKDDEEAEEDGSLGPKRWSRFVVDEEEEPWLWLLVPPSCFLF